MAEPVVQLHIIDSDEDYAGEPGDFIRHHSDDDEELDLAHRYMSLYVDSIVDEYRAKKENAVLHKNLVSVMAELKEAQSEVHELKRQCSLLAESMPPPDSASQAAGETAVTPHVEPRSAAATKATADAPRIEPGNAAAIKATVDAPHVEPRNSAAIKATASALRIEPRSAAAMEAIADALRGEAPNSGDSFAAEAEKTAVSKRTLRVARLASHPEPPIMEPGITPTDDMPLPIASPRERQRSLQQHTYHRPQQQHKQQHPQSQQHPHQQQHPQLQSQQHPHQQQHLQQQRRRRRTYRQAQQVAPLIAQPAYAPTNQAHPAAQSAYSPANQAHPKNAKRLAQQPQRTVQMEAPQVSQPEQLAQMAGQLEALQAGANEKTPKRDEHGKTPAKKAVNIVSKVLFYVLLASLIVGAVLLARADDMDKSLFGFRYFSMTTPSMEPDLPVGSLVFTKAVNASEIQVGDDITVYIADYQGGTFLTHRVVGIIDDGTGQRSFWTRGTNNRSNDPSPFSEDMLVGKVVSSVPHLGAVMTFVQTQFVFVIIGIALVVALFFILRLVFSKNPEEEDAELIHG